MYAKKTSELHVVTGNAPRTSTSIVFFFFFCFVLREALLLLNSYSGRSLISHKSYANQNKDPDISTYGSVSCELENVICKEYA